MRNGPFNERRPAMAGLVYARLRDDIVMLRIKPGTPLSETEMAEALGTSRTPVREAFIRLADDGLLSIVSQVGTRVSRIVVREVLEAQLIRDALECAAIRLTATRATPADLAGLQDILHDQKRAARRDIQRFYALDEMLHERLVAISGAQKVWRIVHAAKAQLDRVRNLDLGAVRRHEDIITEHAAIVAAVEVADPDAAVARLREHLQAVFGALDRLMVERADLFAAQDSAAAEPARARRQRHPRLQPAGSS